MTGSAAYARRADAASAARELLDRVAASAVAVETAQRQLLADLLELWPTCAWRAAGAMSAKRWLLAYTHCAEGEAHRLERSPGCATATPPSPRPCCRAGCRCPEQSGSAKPSPTSASPG